MSRSNAIFRSWPLYLLSMIFVIVGMVATIFLGQIGELLVIAVGIVASIMLWRDVAAMETIA